MLVNVENACYKLLAVLGCDFKAIETISTKKELAVLCMEFAFACLMLYMLWKMLYNAMVKFFNPKAW